MANRKILWPIFSFLIFLSLIITIVSFLITRSSFVHSRVEQEIKNIIESNLKIDVEIGSTEGNILTGYTFNDITLYSQDSIKVGSSEFISVEFNIFSIIKKRKSVNRILVSKPLLDFTKIDPTEILIQKKKEIKEKKEEEPDKKGGIALKNVSIIKGSILLKSGNKSFSFENLNIDGSVYISPTKKRIVIDRCNAKVPYITEVKSLTGILTAGAHYISIHDLSLKTPISSTITIDGNLFDINEKLNVNIKNIPLETISAIILNQREDIEGSFSGELYLQGKKDNLTANGSILVSNIEYNDDSLGQIKGYIGLSKSNLILNNIVWSPPEGKVTIDGSYDISKHNFDATLQLNQFVLDNFIAKIWGKNWRSNITGKISAQGYNINNPLRRKINMVAHLKRSSIKNLSLDSLIADVSYDNKIYTLRNLDLRGKESRLKAQGYWGKGKKLNIESSRFNLLPLFELFGVKDITGYLTMKGYYEEKKDKKIIEALLECENPGFKNIKGELLTGSINLNIPGKNSNIEIKNIDFLNTHFDSLKVFATTDSIIRNLSLFFAGNRTTFFTKANISRENGDFEIIVDTLSMLYRNAEIKNKDIWKITIRDNKLRFPEGTLLLSDIPISINLLIDKDLNYELELSNDSLNLRTLSELIKLNRDMGGTLSFTVKGNGSLRNPRLILDIKAKNVFLEIMKADELTGVFEYLNDAIYINSLKILKNEEISEANAIIPLTIFREHKDPTKTIKFSVIARDLGGWVFYPFEKFCHYEGGKVYGTMKGEGTVGKIDMSGDLRVYSTNIYIPFFGIRLKNTEGYIKLSQEEMEIEKLGGDVGDGFLTLKGKLALRGVKPKTINLDISGQHIPITGFKDLYLTVNPDIKLTGPFSSLFLSGFVKIEKGDITIPFRRKREKGIRRGNFSYDVEISAEEGNIWLKNEDADVELQGNIFAKGTGNAPQLSGSFETKRGFFYYLDNTFTIEKGVFKFTNAPELNPEIDLHAKTKINYQTTSKEDGQAMDTTANVDLYVSGTMQEPVFNLTSDNSSLTEENIMLLLTLGEKSLEDITSASNLSMLSNKAATFWIRQTLLQEFQSTLGIDAIDLETKLLGPQKTAKLTIGKYISKDLYLGATHDIFATSKDEFEIEYKIWKGSYIIGERNEEGRYNLGIRFKFKY
jgi:hypothetical protein